MLICIISGSFAFAQDDRPEKPKINFVSIDTATGDIILDWEKSSSPDIISNIIYKVDISKFPVEGDSLTTVPYNVLTYRYNTGTVNPEFYSICALNAGGSESLLSGDYHKAIKLDVSYDSCAKTIDLKWDKYIGWKNNLSGYKVFMKSHSDSDKKHDGHEFQMIYNSIDTTKLKYEVEDIAENTLYEFYVEAFNNRGHSSRSNVRQKYTEMPLPPNFLHLDKVSVIDDRTVQITFSPDLESEINDFQVSRSSTLNGNYTPLSIINDVNEESVTLEDNFVTQGEQYYYKVEAVNSCFIPVLESNTANNILLRGETEGSMVNLEWTPYTDFISGTYEYIVSRKIHFTEFGEISSLSSDSHVFAEDISSAGNTKINGEIEYYITAVANEPDKYGIPFQSKSNIVNVNVETKIFMPTAFTPDDDGRNDIFEPIFDFIPKEFKFFIYDKSGKVLFRSTDPLIGWDGRINGSMKAPESVYIYHLEYLSYNGVRQVLTGNLTLIYP